MTSIEKSFHLHQELEDLLTRFKTETVPEFDAALGKLPEDHRSMIVSLLATANSQRFSFAKSMANMEVFEGPIENLGNALGLDEKKQRSIWRLIAVYIVF